MKSALYFNDCVLIYVFQYFRAFGHCPVIHIYNAIRPCCSNKPSSKVQEVRVKHFCWKDHNKYYKGKNPQIIYLVMSGIILLVWKLKLCLAFEVNLPSRKIMSRHCLWLNLFQNLKISTRIFTISLTNTLKKFKISFI